MKLVSVVALLVLVGVGAVVVLGVLVTVSLLLANNSAVRLGLRSQGSA